MRARLLALLTGAVAAVLVLVAIAADAARRRDADAARDASRRELVERLGTADLALSSTSRWLRHPSLAEPGAPFADGPASLDTDPAGAAIGAPREIFSGAASR